METMTEFIHQHIQNHHYDVGVDFTLGNGHDTLFLSQWCQHVYSYDIQELALNNSKELLKNRNNVSMFLKSHELFDEDVSSFDVGVFNLGYLPGGDHECTTHYDVTLKTIKKALDLLNPKGYLYVAVYIGHDQGEESRHLDAYFQSLHHKLFNVAKFEMINKTNAPYVVMIEKR